MEPDDSELVRRAQDGDREAFTELIERYREKVYSICYGKLNDEQDSRDVSQEVFIKVYRHLENFDRDSSFYTWLYRITVNACIDFLRKHSRVDRVEYDDEIQSEETRDRQLIRPSTLGFEPETEFDRKELREKMLEALESLSEKHRTILNLREVQGLSYEEMAEVLDIAKGTVMSRLHHARKYFQEALEDYLEGADLEA